MATRRGQRVSAKEESIYGFFPAAKDIRAFRSHKQWESVKHLVNFMRQRDTEHVQTRRDENKFEKTIPGTSEGSLLPPLHRPNVAAVAEPVPTARLPKRFVQRKSKDASLPVVNQYSRDNVRRFKNFTLIGHSCGEYKQDELAYTDFFFQRSVPVRTRYFFVHPEWLSEKLTLRHLKEELHTSPFRYGWP